MFWNKKEKGFILIYTIIIGMICSFIVVHSFKIEVEKRKSTINRLKYINESRDDVSKP